ncbi:MAG: single-stranded DNA-binding protein [Candidatus Marinimicrobia bacterium]|nr:single-stranded DNA-binding protein [Candidatus Neomarinimicrobiota bacterium]MCH7618776.1 single-stranded DNA-binding protein [Candidatus Neomarinimicrobiota bacterium]MCH8288402.1 single-stranded DNA-binding protein [Candidatus Neomarinimicrobiota bacterium]
MGYSVSSMNKVILIGRLGGDPELKYTSNGTAQALINLATSERWKDSDGNQQEKTEWHRVIAWRRQAEFAGEWLKKGRLVCIEGKLSTRSWEKDGQKRYMTEVVADNITMLGSKAEGGGGESKGTPPKQEEPPDNGDVMEDDDDLPF